MNDHLQFAINCEFFGFVLDYFMDSVETATIPETNKEMKRRMEREKRKHNWKFRYDQKLISSSATRIEEFKKEYRRNTGL